MVIIKNLSPLVGSKQNSKRWNPYTARKITTNINIARLICTDTNADYYKKGFIDYRFTNRVTVKTHELYESAKNYSPIVLDDSYAIEVTAINGIPIPIRDLLYMHSFNDTFNDSSIIDILDSNRELRYCGYYKHIMLVLLDSYSLRWSLFEHFIEGKELDIGEVTSKRLTSLIDNIKYIKVKLEEWDSDKAIELNHHLTTLLFNVQGIKSQISDRIIIGGA